MRYMMCQRPKRAYFISTKTKAFAAQLSCVNALNGLTSFLPEKRKVTEREYKMCQRPKRAYFISTEMNSLFLKFKGVCQRPKRAYFISTVPSKTP